MKILASPGVLGVPLCRRGLSTTSRACRELRKAAGKQTSGSRSSPHGSSLNAKLSARSRANSVGKGHDPKTRIRLDGTKKYRGRHDLFRNTVLMRLHVVLDELSKSEYSNVGISDDELNRQAVLFMDTVDESFMLADQNIIQRDKNPLFWNLRDAFIQKDTKGLTSELRYAFQSFLVRHRFSRSLEDSQQRLLDLRFPLEWYPATREVQRTIHVHVGPTNSGKTYHALKALEKSRNGVYAGPLRLLATEVYQRLQAKGFFCALYTGEEIRYPPDSDRYFTSCTVEMVPLNMRFDVAVIDEIQMLGDRDRGNAWTSALLGVQAQEVHVCGEERAVELVQALCASVGDKCVIHRYERLSPLRTMDTALGGGLGNLQKGDAVIAFNRLGLHILKQRIESETGRRCAIIYGGLPPEVRTQQAALFNDPENDYDYVVASDAIGMGLNLEIRRVILDTVAKFDGNQNRLLTYPEIKQIGGRAGRYRSATNPDGKGAQEEGMGYVTTVDHDDLRHVHKAFNVKVKNIEHAYFEPPPRIIERFASYYPPGTPLSFILMRIRTAALVGSRFRMTVTADRLEVADMIQDISLTIPDRLVFCNMPVRLHRPGTSAIVRAMARAVSENQAADLLTMTEIPLHVLDSDFNVDMNKHGQEYLEKLESLHEAITMYTWASYRYPTVFRDQALGFHVRSLVQQRMVDVLERQDFSSKNLDWKRKRDRQQAHMRVEKTKTLAADEYEFEDAEEHPADLPEPVGIVGGQTGDVAQA